MPAVVHSFIHCTICFLFSHRVEMHRPRTKRIQIEVHEVTFGTLIVELGGTQRAQCICAAELS